MANIISTEKAKKFRSKAFLTNIRYMQERVVAMNAEQNKEDVRANSPVNQESKSKSERN